MKNALTVMVATGAYGVVLGWWRSPLLAAYVAVKLPAVFFCTMLAVSGFCWVASLALDADMRYRDIWASASEAMATAGCIIFAAAPVVLFFVVTAAPDSGARNEMRFAHACIMLVHIAVLACGGAVGVWRLHGSLKRYASPRCGVRGLIAIWLTAFGVVGCQLGWIVRPMVGSPNICVEFVREDALERNFLESLFGQIIPHFIKKGEIVK